MKIALDKDGLDYLICEVQPDGSWDRSSPLKVFSDPLDHPPLARFFGWGGPRKPDARLRSFADKQGMTLEPARDFLDSKVGVPVNLVISEVG